MAYAQPRYGVAPKPIYGHPEPSYESQQQHEYMAYVRGNGHPNYDNHRETPHQPAQYPLGQYHTSQSGPTGPGQEVSHFGENGQDGDPTQGGGYVAPAVQHMQHRGDNDEMYVYRERRSRPPPQSNHYPPSRSPQPFPLDEYQPTSSSRGPQKPRTPQNGLYQEPVLQNGSTYHGGYQRNNQYYEPHENQGHRVQRPAIATSKSADSVSQRPRTAGENQQHGFSGSYGDWPVQGGSGNRRPGSVPKPAPSHRERQPTPPKIATAQISKPKERILGDPTSPDTIAWDNPFPTFPTAKKKASQTNGISLNTAVAGMGVQNDPHRDHMQEQRPSTTSIKSNKSSSYGNERNPNVRHKQDHPDGRYQNRQDVREESNGTQHDDKNQYDAQPHEHQINSVSYEPPKHSKNGGEEWPIPYDSHPPDITGRRLEDANAASSFRPLKSNVSPGTQRSKDMPNKATDGVSSSDHLSKYAESSWQEPGPNAGYYGPNDKDYLPKNPAKTHPFQTRPVNHTKAQANVYSPIQSNPYQTPSSAHPTPHSAQDSIGDLFDSYYDASHHDQGNIGQFRGRRPQSDIDEDMPNFDAIPDAGTTHRRGTTIDEHLEPEHALPAIPPVPSQYRGSGPEQRRMGPGPPGQVPRSSSSPNLKEPRSPRSPIHGGFNFDVPGIAPAVPTKLLPRDYGGNKIPNVNLHLYSSQQIYGQQGKPHHTQRPGPPASRSLGNGASVHQPPPRISQERARNGQHQPPVPQAPRPSASQGRQSDDNMGPRSPTSTESRPASAPSNPDALPSHPIPIRPGLMQGSQVQQAPKPVPIRQYKPGSSPLQLPSHIQPPEVTSRALVEKRRGSAPVTHEELGNLRQIIAISPSDQKTQLILAKKMVEAASVLIDQRADQRTKAKTRERYILDAHKIVKKLVSNGYSDASFYLADCYSRGFLGLETDPKEAFNLYQSAAKAGHPQGAYRVAVCCEMGQEEGGGTKRDPLKAMQWYKRAATLGDPPAMYKMGIIQLKGLLGQPKNLNQAVTWLKRAADRADEENPHALHELGLLHEKDTGNEGVIKDEAYSMQLFTQAAKLGYKFSQFRLGCAYEYGMTGCPVDPRQSIAWYSKAAVQEEHQSELALSGWYLTGSEGVLQQSDTEAYLWARKAATAGLAKAEYAMGYFTEVGIGAPANLEDAKRWYWRAASQNFPKARDRLEDLRRGGAKMEKSRVSRSAVNKQSEGDCVIM